MGCQYVSSHAMVKWMELVHILWLVEDLKLGFLRNCILGLLVSHKHTEVIGEGLEDRDQVVPKGRGGDENGVVKTVPCATLCHPLVSHWEDSIVVYRPLVDGECGGGELKVGEDQDPSGVHP